jgi:hypothetical protein
MVLSKVVTAESLQSNGVGGRMAPEPHYSATIFMELNTSQITVTS